MAITIFEKPDSRSSEVSRQGAAATLRFKVMGSSNEDDVRALVEATLPATYQGGKLMQYHVTAVWADGVLDNGEWDVDASYAPQGAVVNFSIGGATAHITQSKETVQRYSPGDDAPDFKGAIGVNNDSVEGVDIHVPKYEWSETHYRPAAEITPVYRAILFDVAEKPVNSDAFRGFEPGEVLFLGCEGSKRGSDQWELTYKFAASRNRADPDFVDDIGDITNVEKEGWDYLWIRYEDRKDTASHSLVKVPKAVYVERVYDKSDFADLEIGTDPL